MGLPEERLEAMSTQALVVHAIDDMRQLAKAEVRYAKEELREELLGARAAALFLCVAVILVAAAVALVCGALALQLPFPPAWGLSAAALALLAVAGALAGIGSSRLPKRPLGRARDRIKQDLAMSREQMT